MKDKIKDIRRKHNRNLPFNGIEIKPFNEPKISVKIAKTLESQDLGYYIKNFDCPNAFYELSQRLWKDCKYQYTQIMGPDKSYDLFIDVMFLWVRSKIHQWDDDRKTGKFFGWCKTAMFNNLLSETRNSDYKRNKSFMVNLDVIGEFTNDSKVQYEAGIWTEPETEEFSEEFNKKSDFEILLNNRIAILDELDKNILNKIVVEKNSIANVAIELNIKATEVQTRLNRTKKILKKDLIGEYELVK